MNTAISYILQISKNKNHRVIDRQTDIPTFFSLTFFSNPINYSFGTCSYDSVLFFIVMNLHYYISHESGIMADIQGLKKASIRLGASVVVTEFLHIFVDGQILN